MRMGVVKLRVGGGVVGQMELVWKANERGWSSRIASTLGSGGLYDMTGLLDRGLYEGERWWIPGLASA
jgi:hypothetical protein